MVVDRPHSLASALCTRETYSVARINVTSVSRLARLDSVRLTSTRLARSIRIGVTPKALCAKEDFPCTRARLSMLLEAMGLVAKVASRLCIFRYRKIEKFSR